MSEHETSNQLSVTEKEINGTTYIVKACYSPDATETLYEMIKRLILQAFKNGRLRHPALSCVILLNSS